MRLQLLLTLLFTLALLSDTSLTENRNDTSLPQANWFLDQIFREHASDSQLMNIKGRIYINKDVVPKTRERNSGKNCLK